MTACRSAVVHALGKGCTSGAIPHTVQKSNSSTNFKKKKSDGPSSNDFDSDDSHQRYVFDYRWKLCRTKQKPNKPAISLTNKNNVCVQAQIAKEKQLLYLLCLIDWVYWQALRHGPGFRHEDLSKSQRHHWCVHPLSFWQVRKHIHFFEMESTFTT